MSETVILCTISKRAFGEALRGSMARLGIVDNGFPDRPALVAPGHRRPVYVDEYPNYIDEAAEIDDISPAALRDEFARTLGQRTAYCVALHYGDVELLKKLLIPILNHGPTLVDNDFGLRANGASYLARLSREPGWNLTDP